MSINPIKNYYQFIETNSHIVVEKVDKKPYSQQSAITVLSHINNTKKSFYANQQLMAQGTDLTMQQVVKEIFDGYASKFGFMRHFNSILLWFRHKFSLNWGDENYSVITSNYKEIMLIASFKDKMPEAPN